MARPKSMEEADSKHFTINSDPYVVTSNLKKRVDEYEEQFQAAINDLKKEQKNSKNENLAIIGIFASILTFLSVEVVAFEKITSISKLIGFSAFLISTILLVGSIIEVYLNRNNTKTLMEVYRKTISLKLATIAFVLSCIAFSYKNILTFFTYVFTIN